MSEFEDRVTVRVQLTGKEYALLQLRAEDELCTVEALIRGAVDLLTKGSLKRRPDGSWGREYVVSVFDYDVKQRIVDYD